MATGLAEKTFTSGLPDLLAAFGNKTKQTQSVTANTAPLQTVFANSQQPMSPELYQALISNIMQTAAQQVPELSGALANATGSRTSNNSPLALAIAQLQANAANAGASKVLDYNQNQQQIAANAASGLANATRTQTTSTTAGKPAVNPLAQLALGFAANQFDKRGGFDKMFGRGAASGSSGGAFTVPSYEQMAPQIQQFKTDFAPFEAGASFAGPGIESFGPQQGLDLGGVGSISDLGFSDFLTGGGFTSDSTGSDFLGEIFGGDVSSGLDLGGADLEWTPDEWWFADGGVIRNKNNLGGPIQRQGMSALTVPAGANLVGGAGAGNSETTSNQLLSMIVRAAQQGQQATGSGTGSDIASEGRSTPGGAVNSASGNPLGQAVAKGFAGFGNSMALGPMLGQLGPAGSLLAKEGMKSSGIPTSGLLGLLTAIATSAAAESRATEAINMAQDPLGAMIAAMETAQPGRIGDVSGATSNTDTAVAAANALSAVNNTDPLDALMSVTNAFGTGTDSDLGDPSNGDAAGAAADAAAGGAASDAAANEGSPGYVDGGAIAGPGTGTSDSIHATNRIPGGKSARFSNGEFIFPADSVKVLGEDLLMRLLKATHTPVRR